MQKQCSGWLDSRSMSYLGVKCHITCFPFRSVTLEPFEGFRRNLTQMFTRLRWCAEAMFWMTGSVCLSVCPLAISLPLCNSWTLWRISKKHDTNVNQTETMCRSNVLNDWIQGHRLAIYSNSSFTFGPCIETRDVDATVFSVQQRPNVVIVFIYKSPTVSCKALLDLLQQIQTKYVKSTKAVLLGD